MSTSTTIKLCRILIDDNKSATIFYNKNIYFLIHVRVYIKSKKKLYRNVNVFR